MIRSQREQIRVSKVLPVSAAAIAVFRSYTLPVAAVFIVVIWLLWVLANDKRTSTSPRAIRL
jgi:hypothetical protein